jgi:lipopolysaccharide/colanic/teichoic acid biosynthesis glycosyltransferase
MRPLDAPVSALGLVLLSPVLALIALLLKMDSPGPIFYRAIRVGRGGATFRLYKFRTMVENAEYLGPGITGSNDMRVTRFGRRLRRYKLDELPQLFNVLKGDMSLVGPRPEDPRYVSYYTPQQKRLLELRPGITSAASLAFRDEADLLTGDDLEQEYIHVILPRKLALEIEYQQHRTIWSDLQVIWRTARLLIGDS